MDNPEWGTDRVPMRGSENAGHEATMSGWKATRSAIGKYKRLMMISRTVVATNLQIAE